MFNGSQGAGFVPEGWMWAHKLQFLFCLFFCLPVRKGEAGGWELQMCNWDLSNEVGFAVAKDRVKIV